MLRFVLLFCYCLGSLPALCFGQAAISLVSRTSTMKGFPCTECHKSYKPGEISMQQSKEHPNMNFKHMPEVLECRMCHSTQSPNKLNLLEGTIVSYDEMNKLCGQCHGKMEYEWTRGLHGREIGMWNGDRERYLCAECHNPHDPEFPSMITVGDLPLTPDIIQKGGDDEHK